MLNDRYGNALSTASAAARDAYVEGCDLMFASWPGAREAFGRATADDPVAAAEVGDALTSAAALWGDTALAPAVAVEADSASASGSSHETFVPLTGRRPSIRPVSVAMTTFG